MDTYILTDSSNLFHRQANMVGSARSADDKVGMSLHLILQSMKKEFNRWNGTHVVFFKEGHSWRKSVYPDYKAQRKLLYAQKSIKEQQEHEVLVEAFDNLADFINEKTNVTVLQNPEAEADDMIAIWIESHPDDMHILISSDSDFIQLLKYPNFKLYDPVKDILLTKDGAYNDKGERVSFTVTSDAKIKMGKVDPMFEVEPGWHDYALFLKCIRGDSSDNILSAYPGVREKGTKTSVGIKEAYEDRISKGYAWNNFMNQVWTDHNGNECRVRTKYEFNKSLIDLSQIPDNVKMSSLQIIADSLSKPSVPAIEIGHAFMKFTGTWDLKRISATAGDYMPMLKSKYNSQS